MNWELIKHKICRLLATAAILLGGTMLSAAATGTMPLWAALLGLGASIVLLNAVCGVLLAAPTVQEPVQHKRTTVQLHVVRGGHAA